MELIQTVGRRKRSVARALVTKGTGKITINKRDSKEYFPSAILHSNIVLPMSRLEVANKYDVNILVNGGGMNGQSDAIRLAIARAMVMIDPESKKKLRAEGMMTRDARKVERKKPGQKKARKRFQFTKR